MDKNQTGNAQGKNNPKDEEKNKGLQNSSNQNLNAQSRDTKNQGSQKVTGQTGSSLNQGNKSQGNQNFGNQNPADKNQNKNQNLNNSNDSSKQKFGLNEQLNVIDEDEDELKSDRSDTQKKQGSAFGEKDSRTNNPVNKNKSQDDASPLGSDNKNKRQF